MSELKIISFHPEDGENKINCGICGSRPALKRMKTELHHSGHVLISPNVQRLCYFKAGVHVVGSGG